MTPTLQIARYGVRDLIRSRWVVSYALFFSMATLALLRFSDSEVKALLSLVNVALLVVPLANIVFGAMYLYASREFVELLLAQPVRRSHLYRGLYLGMTVPVMLAGVAGILVPLLVAGAPAAALRVGVLLAGITAVLTAVFTALAAVIAYRVEDRVRGLATAIGVWVVLALAYDAAVLMASVRFADYPLERAMVAAMFANPIDLARLLLLTQLDIAALLGYTGAAFQRFLGGPPGLVLASGVVVLWVAIPVLTGARLFQRKDF